MADESTALALDHLTVVDALPSALIEVAADVGCRAVSLFLESMDVLPRMPRFSLVADAALRRETKARLADRGVALDVAYPFTLAGRTDVAAFLPALDVATELGAYAINVLAYDREPARLADRFAALSALAAARGLATLIEFFPPSRVATLEAALDLARGVAGAAVNVDLLHLMRSGGSVAALAAAPPALIGYGQFADGAADMPTAARDAEASSERRLAGEGAFDLAGFAAALPRECRTSVEIPRDSAIVAGLSPRERARVAVAGVHQAITGGA